MTVWDRDSLNAPHTEREIGAENTSNFLRDEVLHLREEYEGLARLLGWPDGARDVMARFSALADQIGPDAMTEAAEIARAVFAEWPHAGAMHMGARMACDEIIRRIKEGA